MSKKKEPAVRCKKCGRARMIDVGMGIRRCLHCGSEYSHYGASGADLLKHLSQEGKSHD